MKHHRRQRIRRTALACLLILNIGDIYSRENDLIDTREQPDYVLYIEAVARGDDAELRVNDLPVGTVSGDETLFSRNVERALLPGRNTLSIHPRSEKSFVQARIAAYRPDEFVDGRGGLTFILAQSSEGKEALAEGELSPRRAEREWQSNDRLTGADREDALRAVEAIYDALSRGDTEALSLFLTPVLMELAKAAPGVDQTAHTEDLAARIKDLKTRGEWRFRNFDRSQVKLVPAADGRLFDVRRMDDTPFFRTDHESRSEWFSLWSMIGRQEGEWRIYH